MSEAQTSNRPVVLVVSDNSEHPLQRLGETLKQRGCDVYGVPDVYAAMAYLARGLGADYVLLDAARLDAQESEFLVLAPRYFHRSRVLTLPEAVPSSHIGFSQDAANVRSIDQMLEDILAPEAAVEAEPAITSEPEDFSAQEPGDWPEAQSIDLELAADQVAAEGEAESPPWDGLESSETTSDAPLLHAVAAQPAPIVPAMHDTVRQRMSEFRPATVQRTPPRAVASADYAAAARPAATARQLLTPEELSALLGDKRDGSPDRAGGAS